MQYDIQKERILSWNKLFIALMALFVVSCKPQNLVGSYQLKSFPKISITLEEDGSFEFRKINPNPYLHSFDHPDEYYFITRGTWKADEDHLILNSYRERDSLFVPEVISTEIIKAPSDSIRRCSIFTFYDVFGDTVNVLYANFPNGSTVHMLHRSMKFVEWPVVPGPFDQFEHSSDTIEFHFYGYAPYTFVRNDKISRNVKIRLLPKIQGGLFKEKRFQISRHAIKDEHLLFRKKKR